MFCGNNVVNWKLQCTKTSNSSARSAPFSTLQGNCYLLSSQYLSLYKSLVYYAPNILISNKNKYTYLHLLYKIFKTKDRYDHSDSWLSNKYPWNCNLKLVMAYIYLKQRGNTFHNHISVIVKEFEYSSITRMFVVRGT